MANLLGPSTDAVAGNSDSGYFFDGAVPIAHRMFH